MRDSGGESADLKAALSTSLSQMIKVDTERANVMAASVLDPVEGSL